MFWIRIIPGRAAGSWYEARWEQQQVRNFLLRFSYLSYLRIFYFSSKIALIRVLPQYTL